MKKIIIAIDGYSSCGKSTLAKDLAKELHYIYIDSGAMYRAVTFYALKHQLIKNSEIDTDSLRRQIGLIKIHFSVNHATAGTDTYLNGENVEKPIRSLEVSSHVSRISELGFVREKLVALQQEMGLNKGIVMDGRDIGTVVFPQAELKIFMTADPMVRAQRRFDEIKFKGDLVSLEKVLENLKQRDFIDTNRKISPLVQASDAIVLDNSYLTQKQQLEWVLEKAKAIIES